MSLTSKTTTLWALFRPSRGGSLFKAARFSKEQIKPLKDAK